MHFKALLTTVAISALLGYMPVANAADVVNHHPHHVKHMAPIAPVVIVPSAPAFSWTGPYLGVETGMVITKFHSLINFNPIVIDEEIIRPKEQPAVGLFAGYNFALSQQIILGIDGNIDYHSVKSPNSDRVTYTKYKEDVLAAARIRLGLMHGRILPYIAGGLSAARAGLGRAGLTLQETNNKNTYMGWNIGGGLDYAVSHKMFLRLDYRFSQVKIKDLYARDNNGGDLVRYKINTQNNSHEIRVGAAYKF